VRKSMNLNKLYPLYQEEGLPARRRRGRKRARGNRTPALEALCPGDRWSMDFASDTLGASRKFSIDDCCRENLCLAPVTSISGNGWRANWMRWFACTGSWLASSVTTTLSLQAGRSCNGPARTRSGVLHRSRKAPTERLHR
jgi:hypothetical protein